MNSKIINMSNFGYFGRFGGRYVPEVLRKPLDELEVAFIKNLKDKRFLQELEELQRDFIGRPTPLLFAENLTSKLKGAKIYIKMEGLAHTGAHKINNAIGQALLAKRIGKRRIIAETGAGQHGLATASACAKLGLQCVIYMGEVDVRRQQPNVVSMEMYGATVVSVKSGSRTLKDAINEAMRDWAANFECTHYIIGSALGPSPFPDMVRTFQSIIGKEIERETNKRNINVKALIACVGGGSNAIGFFEPFIGKDSPRLIAVEAGGIGIGEGKNAVRMFGDAASDGIVHGYKSKFLLNKDGQVGETRSISAGLDYPGIGPELAYLGERGRIEFKYIEDKDALEALKIFAREEGIIFALESAHAGALALKIASSFKCDEAIVINMSGRGDKDIFITSPIYRAEKWSEFLENELNRLKNGIDIHYAASVGR